MNNLRCFCALTIYVALAGAAPSANRRYYLSPEKANYFQAFYNCQSAGMQLASVHNEEEFYNLDTYITPYKVEGYGNAFWISGNNLNNPTSKQYYWPISGSPAIYTKWVSTEPDNALGAQHCMTWAVFQGITGWADDICDAKYRYICENR